MDGFGSPYKRPLRVEPAEIPFIRPPGYVEYNQQNSGPVNDENAAPRGFSGFSNGNGKSVDAKSVVGLGHATLKREPLSDITERYSPRPVLGDSTEIEPAFEAEVEADLIPSDDIDVASTLDVTSIDVKAEEPIVLPPDDPRPTTSKGSEIPFESPLTASQGSAAAFTESDESENGDEQDELGRPTCRKEKSLGLLCQRFIMAMREATAGNPSNSVHLESVAVKMKVEKRRIYDIVNVMEALDAMSKLNKSYYAWHGLGNLPKLMSDLQREAIDESLPERILRVEQAMCSFTDLSPGAKRKDIVGTLIDQQLPSSSSSPSPFPSASPADSPYSMGAAGRFIVPSSNSCNSPSTSTTGGTAVPWALKQDPKGSRNSLAMLCRRFIMVLLANPEDKRRVSLDVASTVLIKDPETEGFEPPSRGRCRRLYDIANVLVAMGIIRKVHYLFGTKKIPLFDYCGPEPDSSAILTDEKLEEMMVGPRAAIDEVIREKTIGKRSKSEACIDDAMRRKPSKMSKTECSLTPQDSPVTAAWKMMELANACEKERIMRERLSFVIPVSPGSKRRISQSTSNLSPSSSSFWNSTSSSIPSSPLAMAASAFVLPHKQPWMNRTSSEASFADSFLGAPTGIARPSPKGMANQSQPALYRIMTPKRDENSSSSTPSAVRRVLVPMQHPPVSSPRQAPPPPAKRTTPKYSIKRILGASPLRPSNNLNIQANNSPDRLRSLENRGGSLFKAVKRPVPSDANRASLQAASAHLAAAASLASLRYSFPGL